MSTSNIIFTLALAIVGFLSIFEGQKYVRKKASYRTWLSPEDSLNWKIGLSYIGMGIACTLISTIVLFENLLFGWSGIFLLGFSLYKNLRIEQEITKMKDDGK